jgi:nitrogen fixation/metabolism regulation signal transduction histidine kinase
MIFNNFRIKIVFRVILLGLSMVLFTYVIKQQEWYVASFVNFMVILGILIELFLFIDKTNRIFKDFLLSIKYKDFTKSLRLKNFGKSFNELNEVYEDIINDYADISTDKESHYNYLLTVVEHINVAIMCFNNQGKIVLCNKAATFLLKIQNLNSIDKIKAIDPKLYNKLNQIKSGKTELYKLLINGELLQLSIFATSFKLKNESLKLVSLQNIQSELEEHELDSWKKLIRVLTHEIMNSVTPISSLSESINQLFENKDDPQKVIEEFDETDYEEMTSSFQSIEKRSKGLLGFVNQYRKLTKLPPPEFQEMNLNAVINEILVLYKKQINESHINLSLNIPEEISINADKGLLEQVFINLLLNAIDAVCQNKNPEIEILAQQKENTNCLLIRDNGKGISKENIDQIFVPFFTTKEKGSGIGLSLCRQIMQLHKGSIKVNSKENEGTTFVLEF